MSDHTRLRRKLESMDVHIPDDIYKFLALETLQWLDSTIERLRSPWVSVGERLPEDESAEYQVALIGAELKPLCVLDNIEWRDGLFRYGESKSNTFATYAHGHTPSEAVVYAWRIHQPDTPPPAPSEV